MVAESEMHKVRREDETCLSSCFKTGEIELAEGGREESLLKGPSASLAEGASGITLQWPLYTLIDSFPPEKHKPTA